MQVSTILWSISFIKTLIIRIIRRIFRIKHKSLSKIFSEKLVYPVELDELSFWVNEKNPFGILDFEKTDMNFKFWIKSLKHDELVVLHNYYNTLRYFNKSRIIFHEILRRESKLLMIFALHGTKRFLMSKILLSQILSKKSNNDFKIKLFMYLSHPWKYKYYSSLVKDKKVSLIGGGSEVKRGKQIDTADLVARLNTMKINENDHVNVGKRVDIVFLRGERSQHLFEVEGKYALTMYQNILVSFKLKNLYKKFICQFKAWTFSTDATFHYGVLNGVQSSIFDLYWHGAKNIYLYGVNFNIEGSYMKGYRPPEMVPVKFDLIFGSHPPHIQFIITQFFVNKGFVIPSGDASYLFKFNYRQFSKVFDQEWSMK